MMSSQSLTQCASDYGTYTPQLGGGAMGSDSGAFGSSMLRITGTPTSWTTTIASLTAKNRSTPQKLNVTLTSSLSGTANLTNGLASVTFSATQTFSPQTALVFTAQSNVVYYIASGSGTSWTLTTAYTGSNAAASSFNYSFSAYQLITNTTHSSTAWASANTTAGIVGTNADVTQPLLVSSGGGSGAFGYSEVDTWAASDTLTFSTLPYVRLSDLRPVMLEKGHNSGAGALQFDNLIIAGQCGTVAGGLENIGDSSVHLGPDVNGYNLNFEPKVRVDGVADRNGVDQPCGACANCTFSGNFSGGYSGSGLGATPSNQQDGFQIIGGQVLSQTTGGKELTVFQGALLGGDVYLRGAAGNFNASGWNAFGAVETDLVVKINSGVLDAQSAWDQSGASPANIVWGSGTIDAGRGRVYYVTGATGGATEFPTIALKAGNTTVGCIFQPNASTTTFTCNTSFALGSNLDSALGGFSLGGCIGTPGSSFCNMPY